MPTTETKKDATAKDESAKAPKVEGTVAEREAKIAALQAEIAELQKPEPVPFPKWKYHPEQPAGVVVNDADAEQKLGAGWVDSPADFPDVKAKAADAKAKSADAKAAKE